METRDLNLPENHWLLSAVTENENIEIINDIVYWQGGVWRGGVWRGGVWRDGEWRGGEWRGGVWRGGEWRGGEWRGGVWWGGEWRGGEWRGGEWQGGVWRGGVWRDGEWQGGVWQGGVWRGGVWRGGVWRDGVWRGGEWWGGEWRGGKWQDKTIHRLTYMCGLCGIIFNKKGFATAYRKTRMGGQGCHNSAFIQRSGKYHEEDLPEAGAGTCVKGIHVCSLGLADHYFSREDGDELWEVRFKLKDLLDCDGEKARIRGGTFKKIKWPWKIEDGAENPRQGSTPFNAAGPRA